MSSERREYELTGTVTQHLSLAPQEFVGMSSPVVTLEVMAILASIAPHVSFASEEVDSVVADIEAANKRLQEPSL